MSRKLVFLNIVLVALLAAAGWEIRQRLTEAKTREQTFLNRPVPSAPAPATPKNEPPAPVAAASYAEVATKMLFAKDRNPNVVIEAAPEEPVPPFPVLFGVLAFGDQRTAFMAESPGKPQKSYRPGENVGLFKLASLDSKEVVLLWKDKTFKKRVEELKPKADAPPPVQTAVASNVPKDKAPTYVPASDEKVKKIYDGMTTDGKPGVEVGAAQRGCAPGDTAAPGTVQGGYKKVLTANPFGQTCRWEPVR